MSFWSTSDGELATQTGGSYESPTGNTDPIPDGSSVLAMIASAQWKNPRNDDAVEYVELEWTVAQPEEYANRKIWQKLWIDDLDPSAKDEAKAIRKRDNHKRMLAAIDANCGGKLAKKGVRPSDTDLAVALMQRPMVIKVKIWENDKGEPGGNWICGVNSKTSAVSVAPAAAPKPKAMAAAGAGAFEDDEDEIPF